MFDLIIKNGGATFNQHGKIVQLKSGYQVSCKDLYKVPVKDFKPVLSYVLTYHPMARGQYIGVWIDNGYAYIDISKRIATKKQAIQFGKQLKQLSILRWKDMQCLAI